MCVTKEYIDNRCTDLRIISVTPKENESNAATDIKKIEINFNKIMNTDVKSEITIDNDVKGEVSWETNKKLIFTITNGDLCARETYTVNISKLFDKYGYYIDKYSFKFTTGAIYNERRLVENYDLYNLYGSSVNMNENYALIGDKNLDCVYLYKVKFRIS